MLPVETPYIPYIPIHPPNALAYNYFRLLLNKSQLAKHFGSVTMDAQRYVYAILAVGILLEFRHSIDGLKGMVCMD